MNFDTMKIFTELAQSPFYSRQSAWKRRTKTRMIVVVAIVLTSSASAQDFSCRMGMQASCLDYGDTVCSSRGMCVDKNAACFDSNQCNYKGFTCKSNVTECGEAHDALLKKHNELVDDFNGKLEILKKMAVQLEDIQTCLNYASTLDAAKLCAP